MTAKKGTLWKTSWNRARGTPTPDYVGSMWVFRDFFLDGANFTRYLTAVASSLGTGLPFWFSTVGLGPDLGKLIAAAPGFTSVAPISDDGFVTGRAGVGALDATVGPLAVPGDRFVSASIWVVRPIDATFSVRSVLCDQLSDYEVSIVPYTPSTAQLLLNPQLGDLHGFAGGPFDLTVDEIHQWFVDLKANLAIQPIPGKTSHLYSAANTPAVVPDPLVNLGSAGAAQDMPLDTTGAPVPANVLTPVRFAY